MPLTEAQKQKAAKAIMNGIVNGLSDDIATDIRELFLGFIDEKKERGKKQEPLPMTPLKTEPKVESPIKLLPVEPQVKPQVKSVMPKQVEVKPPPEPTNDRLKKIKELLEKQKVLGWNDTQTLSKIRRLLG